MSISIAMASYNGEKYIKEQIESILTQSLLDFELVISDDCSTDKTFEIIQSYVTKDSRIKCYQNKSNLGFKKNFEQAIIHCSGEYIAFCDQDDIWTKNHLEKLISNIGNNDGIGANSTIIDENEISQGITLKEYWPMHWIPKERQVFLHEIHANIIQGSASLFRKSLIQAALPIPNDIKFHDYWFAIYASASNGCKYIDDVVLMYRRHSHNASKYHKFTLISAIKDMIQFSKDKSSFYRDNVILLNELLQRHIPIDAKNQITTVLNFYTNLSNNRNRLQSIVFFIKNYNIITLSKRRIFPLFLWRIFWLSLFGIKS